LVRAHLVIIRMPPLTIGKDFNVVKQIRLSLGSGPVVSPIHPLPFQGRKEIFGHRIVKAIPGSAHAALKAVSFEQILELLAGILTAAIAGNG